MYFIWWIIVAVVTIIPLRVLLPHFGVNRNWAFAGIIPLGTIALLWLMAAKLNEMEKR